MTITEHAPYSTGDGYLGFIPMITSTNLTMGMFFSGRLKSRIDK